MKKFTSEQIAQIVWKNNPLKATANYPRCPYPRQKTS